MRQGLLSEPEASSGPAAMLLAVSRSPSSIPRRSPCPDRCHLPLASLSPSTLTKPQQHPRLHLNPDRFHLPLASPSPSQQKNGTRQIQHCQTPEPKHPSNRHIQCIINIRYLLNSITTRKFSQQLKIAGLHFNIRSQLLTFRTNIRHLKNAPLTNPTP